VIDRTALFATALGGVFGNKLRSSLTVLGITIGIAAVICVLAIGKAGQQQIEQQLNNLGDSFVWIEAGGRSVGGVRTGSHGTKTMTLGDAQAIKDQVSLIKAVSPNVDASTQLVYGNQNWYAGYRGVSPAFFDIKRWGPDLGAVFTDDDVERAANVCVIGRTVRTQLFGADDPVGKVIRMSGLPCLVVAELEPKGISASGQDQDNTVIIPYTMAMKKLKGVAWLDDILCSAVSQDVVKLAGEQIAVLLRERHHLRGDQPDDFNIRNPEDVIQAQLDASRTLTLLLIAIASISLLVGGIGIMNVMLVSVTERTREIGVRAAVGATRLAIQLQFLGESAMLSLGGGTAGVLLGVIGTVVIGRTLGWPVIISPAGVAIATLFSIGVGLVFGYYPARKASRLNPIEALRYE
jgi:putative ABC transport system permease protein